MEARGRNLAWSRKARGTGQVGCGRASDRTDRGGGAAAARGGGRGGEGRVLGPLDALLCLIEHHGEDDHGALDGDLDFLYGLGAETDVTFLVTDGNDSPESGSLSGLGLLLYGADLHDLVGELLLVLQH